MGWKVGEEKFTNLYVGSEIGPFSGGINKEVNKALEIAYAQVLSFVEKHNAAFQSTFSTQGFYVITSYSIHYTKLYESGTFFLETVS